MDFNHWDIILFLPLLYAAWRGFQKGFIIEVASIAALIAGIYIAANFSEITAEKLKDWFDIKGTWLGYASFIVTFVAVVFGVYALAKVVEKAVNLVALKLVNKLAGSLFGIVKIALILSIVLNLLGWLNRYVPILSKSEPQKSLMFNSIKGFAPLILPVLTDAEWLAAAEEWLAPELEEEVVD
ncbi:MAG: CvpA family protein [Flavobacteriales bacterium]|nr:CvpA family protein [Flavobacteriales bacterium]